MEKKCKKAKWLSEEALQMLCLMSESPSGKREGLQDNATRKKESLLLTRARASVATNAVVQGQRDLIPKLLQKFIG